MLPHLPPKQNETEGQRQERELERVNREKERVESEDIRESAEEQRRQAEVLRETNEAQREENEVTRESNESRRKATELEMVAEERIRAAREADRDANESIRSMNEADRRSEETTRRKNEAARSANENDRIEAEEERRIKFDGWDKTMEGIIPNATDISTGVVKIDKTEGEEAPYKVPTIGRLDNEIAVLKGDVVGKQDKLTAGDNIDIIGDTIGAVDTITTINGKTGAISKADITALGIPSQDTVYKKPSSEPISYIQGLEAELDSKVESYGTNPVLNIAVISAGGSTTGIPNNTLILELE